MTRTVFHEVTVRIKVSAIASSYAEAQAMEAALKALPASSAWIADSACMGDSGEFTGWANVAPPDESTLPPQALADADDNVGDLKAGEAV